MAGFGKKLLGIIGLEEVEEDEDGYYGEDEQPEQPVDYPEEEYEPVDEPSYTNRNYGSPVAKRAPQQHSQIGTSYASTNNYETRKPRPVNGSYAGAMDPTKLNILLYKPTSYDETATIIDTLKSNCAILVNLNELDTEVAQRILDFISGAVYAVSGNIRKAARNMFVVTPKDVNVSTNLTSESMAASAGEFDGHYFSDGDM